MVKVKVKAKSERRYSRILGLHRNPHIRYKRGIKTRRSYQPSEPLSTETPNTDTSVQPPKIKEY